MNEALRRTLRSEGFWRTSHFLLLTSYFSLLTSHFSLLTAVQNCTLGASVAPGAASKYWRGLPMPNTLAVRL
jgi:hypothetical protein